LETDAMDCERDEDEGLRDGMLDVLYGEADAAVRARVEAHLAGCPACREEMAALRALRRDLAAWRRHPARPSFTPRGVVLPRWMAAAAVLLLGFGATLSATGYVSLRRALSAQEARAAELERQQRQTARALDAARTDRSGAVDARAFLASLDARVDEKLRENESRQGELLRQTLAGWEDRAEAQRRVDMARVAASLSYLDGRHGEQLARTNELMGYVLAASQASQKR
jgi:hypothetical protein